MDFQDILYIIILIIVGSLVIGSITTSIYCFINYGNLPITEVPSWALPFMFK